MIYAPLNRPLHLIGWASFSLLGYREATKYVELWEPLHALGAALFGYLAFNIILLLAHIPTFLICSSINHHIAFGERSTSDEEDIRAMEITTNLWIAIDTLAAITIIGAALYILLEP